MRSIRTLIARHFYLLIAILSVVVALLVAKGTAPRDTRAFQKRLTESNFPYDEYTSLMEQSPNDRRHHRLIRLPNGLIALCTHDPLAEKSAAAVAVNVGSMVDPPNLQGMAHFLEHMLFMGSDKYPNENDYASYISNHSGNYNAATAKDITYYYFSIDNNAFESALDRLSWFFREPLLKPECVDKEVHAVDSEFKGTLRNPMFRRFQISSMLSNPSHPYSKFNVGSLETLKNYAAKMNLSLADEVRKFYNTYYSASIMKLSVVGNHSLDQLTEWAVSKFSAVEDKGNTRPQYDGHPLGKTELGKVIFHETMEDRHDMSLEFAIPNMQFQYRRGISLYISALLSVDSPGSILSYLKEKGWATDVGADIQDIIFSGFDTFIIHVELTLDGMKHYKDVVRSIFAYLRMLKDIGPQVWFYEELARVKRLDFQFYKRPDELRWASNMAFSLSNAHALPEHILSQSDVLDDTVDPQEIAEFLEYLQPTKYRLILGAQKHTVKCNNRLPHYNILYHVEPLDPALASEYAHVDTSAFAFQKPNIFIPENLKMSTNASNADDKPALLRLTNEIELWYKEDGQFHTPHGSVYLRIEPRHIDNIPQEHVLGKLFSICLESVLEKELYGAVIAGMKYSISVEELAIYIQLGGFNDKLPLLLSTILERIANFKLSRRDYDVYTVELKKAYSNYHLLSALKSIAQYEDQLSFLPGYHYTAEEYELLNNVTFEKAEQYTENLFKQTFVKMLVAGQFTESDALDISGKAQKIISSKQLSTDRVYNIYAVDVAPGYYMFSTQHTDKDALNGGIVTNIYCGSSDDLRETMVLKLLKPLLHSQIFDQLRTKEQLGYVVYAKLATINSGRSILSFAVQGEHNPLFAKLRIDQFIGNIRTQIAEMTVDDFQTRISALSRLILEKPKSIAGEAGNVWGDIISGKYDFGRKQKQVDALHQLELGDLLDVWDKYVNPETAVDSNYTRVDYLLWSQKAWMPTDKELALYSENTISLQGCLLSDGLVKGSLSEISSATDAIASNSTDAHTNNKDSVLPVIFLLYKDAGSPLKSKVALDMAVGQQSRHYGSTADYSGIDMQRTPEGKWIVRNFSEFKATQELFELPVPVTKLKPKHAN
ncbi:Metalloenzyme, LuxS/M16 peptidase-like protein [Coemansia spiralis]|nr:Metalloenzyme, LuxS/M16 peptidase-like protein [Coemansia spiralis]